MDGLTWFAGKAEMDRGSISIMTREARLYAAFVIVSAAVAKQSHIIKLEIASSQSHHRLVTKIAADHGPPQYLFTYGNWNQLSFFLND
jgi:hypothetical protein